jgi:hypothetical protein
MRWDFLGIGNGVHTPQVNRMDNGLKGTDLHSEDENDKVLSRNLR